MLHIFELILDPGAVTADPLLSPGNYQSVCQDRSKRTPQTAVMTSPSVRPLWGWYLTCKKSPNPWGYRGQPLNNRPWFTSLWGIPGPKKSDNVLLKWQRPIKQPRRLMNEGLTLTIQIPPKQDICQPDDLLLANRLHDWSGCGLPQWPAARNIVQICSRRVSSRALLWTSASQRRLHCDRWATRCWCLPWSQFQKTNWMFSMSVYDILSQTARGPTIILMAWDFHRNHRNSGNCRNRGVLYLWSSGVALFLGKLKKKMQKSGPPSKLYCLIIP